MVKKTAGYSGTPLVKKLGIKPESALALYQEPDDFRALLVDLPSDVEIRTDLRAKVDVAILFVTRRADLAAKVVPAGKKIFPDGAIWAAWPKKACGVPTDITEDTVREIALPMGLVDNKVCAIDDTWSGLRELLGN